MFEYMYIYVSGVIGSIYVKFFFFGKMLVIVFCCVFVFVVIFNLRFVLEKDVICIWYIFDDCLRNDSVYVDSNVMKLLKWKNID